MASIAQFVLVLIWISIIIWKLTYDIYHKKWVDTCFVGIPILVLSVVFGVGGVCEIILNILTNSSESRYADAYIFYSTLLVALGSFLYTVGFRASFEISDKVIPSINGKLDERRLGQLFWVTLIITWISKAFLIKNGLYFTWTSGVLSSANTTSLASEIAGRVDNLIVPLLVYMVIKKNNSIYSVIFGVNTLLVVAKGSRGGLIIYAVLVSISYILLSNQRRADIYICIKYGLPLLVIMFYFIFPVINISRSRLQQDVYKNKQIYETNKYQIVYTYIVDYVPDASVDYISGNYSVSKRAEYEYLRRFGMYQDTMVKLMAKKSKDPPKSNTFWEEVSLVVPGLLYPSKPVVVSAATLQKYLYGYVPSMMRYVDIPSSPVTMAYYFGGGIGVLILLCTSGVIFGVSSSWLLRAGSLAPLLAVGFIPFALPLGNALMSQLVGARDIFIFSIPFILMSTKLNGD